MYKHCFELENETRSWILACKSEQDLYQWYNTIQIQIEQINRRIAIQKMNQKIIEIEKDKSSADSSILDKLVISYKYVLYNTHLQSMLIGYLT